MEEAKEGSQTTERRGRATIATVHNYCPAMKEASNQHSTRTPS